MPQNLTNQVLIDVESFVKSMGEKTKYKEDVDWQQGSIRKTCISRLVFSILP